LYLEKFDPILPDSEIPKGAPIDPAVQMHCDEIAAAEGIVIIHPNWWGQPPAILKGWVDRVIRLGLAYEFAEEDGGEPSGKKERSKPSRSVQTDNETDVVAGQKSLFDF